MEGEASPLPVEVVVVPMGAPLGSPQRPPAGGTWRRGLSLPPFRRPGPVVAPAIVPPSPPAPRVAEEVTTAPATSVVRQQVPEIRRPRRPALPIFGYIVKVRESFSRTVFFL
jgi:hypothetical protein